MSLKSKNPTHMDTIWAAYIATDPDLSELERQKRLAAYRQTRQAFSRKRRMRRFRELVETAASALLIVAALLLLMFGLC